MSVAADGPVEIRNQNLTPIADDLILLSTLGFDFCNFQRFEECFFVHVLVTLVGRQNA